ncbi:MAG: PQQ-dependent sugar dehydrogenase [Chthoniobacterales bacterium]
MKKFALLLAFGFSVVRPSSEGATLPAGFTETQVGGNLSGSPTAMEIAPDGRIFVCQQNGQLRVFKNGALLPNPFVSLSVDFSGERGLLGIAFDPSFATNQFVYVYYTTSSAPVHNRISRFTASGDIAVAGSETILMDLDNLSGATNHNGGAIHFGSDGRLYVAVGENANPANSQSIANRLGKILRLNPDGTIPADNPTSFSGIAGSPTGLNRAIWAVGLRNPFTFAFQQGTGRLFINDVGQSTWEEINDGIAGSNYGWSICEGVCSPANPNYRDPLFQYAHSGPVGSSGCAIVGAAFYNPALNQFPNGYLGKYFFGDLCNGWIRTFDPATGSASAFASGISSLVDLKVGGDGNLYYLTQGNGGQLFRVQFTSTVAVQSAVSRKTHGAAGDFDLSLPLSGTAAIEPRLGGTTGDFRVVVAVTGNGPISVDGTPQAEVTAGSGTVGSGGVSNGGAVTLNGSIITIPLTNVANAQAIRVTLNNVNDGTTTRSFNIPLRVLEGDVTQDAFVNTGDAVQTRARAGQTTGTTNFLFDVNTDGNVNSGDTIAVRARSGTSIGAAGPASLRASAMAPGR